MKIFGVEGSQSSGGRIKFMSRELGINNCIFIASLGQRCKIEKRKRGKCSKQNSVAALVFQRSVHTGPYC